MSRVKNFVTDLLLRAARPPWQKLGQKRGVTLSVAASPLCRGFLGPLAPSGRSRDGIPQLGADCHGVDVAWMFFFYDNTFEKDTVGYTPIAAVGWV